MYSEPKQHEVQPSSQKDSPPLVPLLNLADQNINPNCGTGGYENDPSIVFNFVLTDNPFDGVLQTGYENSDFAIWIDFNDDFVF